MTRISGEMLQLSNVVLTVRSPLQYGHFDKSVILRNKPNERFAVTGGMDVKFGIRIVRECTEYWLAGVASPLAKIQMLWQWKLRWNSNDCHPTKLWSVINVSIYNHTNTDNNEETQIHPRHNPQDVLHSAADMVPCQWQIFQRVVCVMRKQALPSLWQCSVLNVH